MRWKLAPLALMLWAIGCDDGSDSGGRFASDAGFGGDKQICLVDADCAQGEICFAGECVFQGLAPPPPPAGEPDVLPEEREESIVAFTHPAAGVSHVRGPTRRRHRPSHSWRDPGVGRHRGGRRAQRRAGHSGHRSRRRAQPRQR